MFRSFLLCLLLLVIAESPLGAQSFKVVEVEIKGNQAATTSLITSVASINIGEQLTPSTIPSAVKRLYGLGFFSDIQVDAEEVTGGIKILIRVRELPKLQALEFKGNKEIKSDDLEKVVDLATGRYLSPHLVSKKRNEILGKYGEKGYFLAEVDYEVRYTPDSTGATLVYRIREGSKIKVEKVVLTGNQRVEAGKIIGKMRNRKRGFLKSSNFDKEKYPEDLEKIIEYLHKEGYIDAYLKSDSITIDSARNRMTVYLDIYEGPRYYFGKTTWSGNEVFDERILFRTLKYNEGDVFNREKYDESIYEIYFLYQEKGHLHLRVIDDLKTRDSLLDITFDVVEGLPSKVNLVRIIGNTKTKEKVIRREMSTRPGQVFHRSYLMRSVRDIMQLNYFENVLPDIIDLPSGDIDVLVTVTEKQTGQISAGAGYSGQDKFVGTFGLGIPNFRGIGQNLSFNIDVGSRRNSYSISFTEPWMFGTPTLFGSDLYYTNRQWFSDYTEGRRGGSVRLGRRLRWPDNYFRAFIRYRLEDDRFYDFSDGYRLGNSYLSRNIYPIQVAPDQVRLDTNLVVGGPLPGSLLEFKEEWFTSSSLQFTITRDSRNLPEFATSGSTISYSFENVGNMLGGYWEYQKHMLSLAKFIPVFHNIALAGRLTFGAIRASAGDDHILEFDRFSPGGTGYDGTIRGYDDGSLTPDSLQQIEIRNDFYSPDSSEIVQTTYDTTTSRVRVRGKYMLVGNLELQIPIMQNQLYALLFYDIGNSWLNHRDINFDDIYEGVGLGFRLVVPGLGTIGFDFGYPLDTRSGQDKGWHPHFQIGTTFR
ncbi:MAG: outer membrane protein assembly factor BamA [Candidatus Zixiibacteriota bacterium]|nr:MAG: outer membrane protein assembly factor BamA [candidate division Zixibacteria bacterium]